ncbi:SemiSWEET family sugar transporter [Flavicella sediminum]|uniref:SemiSWEET family sugar transporter n=1 Tax=Flavicella sediminum TaxID=2585141 RepID=UPI00111EF8D0|nr:SemiSWEET transporter [Flavicella sediminum]
MEGIPFHVEVVGLIAATLTTISFVPQVYKIWKTKSAESVSLTMFLLFFTGVVLWFVYGVYIGSLSMTIANTITGALSLIIIYYKLKLK